MRRFKPVHGVLLVFAVMAAIVAADYAFEGGFTRASYIRVAPDPDGQVKIDLSGLGADGIRFYRFLNRGNQEVKFFVARDPAGGIQVAFDASEICAKRGRGFRREGDWIVCNTCDKSFQIAGINQGGGGCEPIPLPFRRSGDTLVLNEDEILKGWRLFT